MDGCAAVFLDRDGTINVDKDYLYKIKDFEFLPGAISGMKMLIDKGYKLIIITNQSGIARGYYTEKDFEKLTKWMIEELELQGITITDVFFCPHLPEAHEGIYKKICKCRKPGTQLFYKAKEKWNINFDKSFAIGDKMRDLAICDSTGCRGFLISTKEIKNDEKEKIHYVDSLYSAALQICDGGVSV